MEVLRTDRLTKSYGAFRAVDQLDFQVQEGHVYGLLGPNGSGKTTTLAMILGVIRATEGSYSWFGAGDDARLRRRIGAILEHPIFYPSMSGIDNLKLAARIKEVPDAPYDRLLESVGLAGRHTDAFRTYSLGMKQRLAIASALLADPEVLIFDEPTNGLDPQGIVEIREIIQRIAATGKTIILASHLLDEVQKVCTDFMILQRGRCIFQGTVSESLGERIVYRLRAHSDQPLPELLSELPVELQADGADHLLHVQDPTLRPSDVSRYLAERSIYPDHLSIEHSRLEDRFLAILSDHA